MMTKKIVKIILPLFIGASVFLLFFWITGQQSSGATCEITQIFWRLGTQDYNQLPWNMAVGEKVKAVAKFQNCGAGNKPFFTLVEGGSEKKVEVGALTSNNEEEHNVDFEFTKEGTSFFKAAVSVGGQLYQRSSSQVSVPRCAGNVNFDATPKQVNSASQAITLKAVLNFPSTAGCISHVFGTSVLSVDFEFYHKSNQLIRKISETSLTLPISGSFSKEKSIIVSPQDLGYQMNQNISFFVKIVGSVKLATKSFPVNIISSPVNVGVGQPPEQLKKYQCKNNTCVEDSNGPYNSLDICRNTCGTGGTGAPPVTITYVFNLENPIEAENFQDLVNIIGKWIFNLAIPIAVIIIIYAGVLMLTSGGDPGRFKKGRDALKYAVIGLAIVLIGKGFVTLIQSILSLRNQ